MNTQTEPDVRIARFTSERVANRYACDCAPYVFTARVQKIGNGWEVRLGTLSLFAKLMAE